MSVITEALPYPALIETLRAEYTEQYARVLATDGITTCREHIRQYLRDVYPEHHDRFCLEDYRSITSEFDNLFTPRARRNH